MASGFRSKNFVAFSLEASDRDSTPQWVKGSAGAPKHGLDGVKMVGVAVARIRKARFIQPKRGEKCLWLQMLQVEPLCIHLQRLLGLGPRMWGRLGFDRPRSL